MCFFRVGLIASAFWHVGRVAGERWERNGRGEGGERRAESRGEVTSSELQICHLLGLARNFPWGQRAPTPPPHYLLSLFSVTLYLLLIGFNERFNKTALPDQIKLLLSATLHPGSLLCNASAAQCSPSCGGSSRLVFSPYTHSNLPPLSCPVLLMSLLSSLQQAETAQNTRKVPTGAAATHSASHLSCEEPK